LRGARQSAERRREECAVEVLTFDGVVVDDASMQPSLDVLPDGGVPARGSISAKLKSRPRAFWAATLVLGMVLGMAGRAFSASGSGNLALGLSGVLLELTACVGFLVSEHRSRKGRRLPVAVVGSVPNRSEPVPGRPEHGYRDCEPPDSTTSVSVLKNLDTVYAVGALGVVALLEHLSGERRGAALFAAVAVLYLVLRLLRPHLLPTGPRWQLQAYSLCLAGTTGGVVVFLVSRAWSDLSQSGDVHTLHGVGELGIAFCLSIFTLLGAVAFVRITRLPRGDEDDG
jgi:hypothetical protein